MDRGLIIWREGRIGCAEVVYTTLAILVEIAHHPANVIGQDAERPYKAKMSIFLQITPDLSQF